MLAPHWFAGFDSLMQIVDAAIAFTIGYYALRGYKLIKDRTLFFLHFSFVLLGVGLLVDGVVTIPALAFRGLLPIMALSYHLRITAEIVAYGLLVFAYLKQTRSLMVSAALATLFLEYNPFLEIVVFFLVAYLAVQAAINYSAKKERNSLLVMVGFVLLSVSHMFFILPPVVRLFIVMAHVAQLMGFVALLVMLVKVAGTK